MVYAYGDVNENEQTMRYKWADVGGVEKKGQITETTS